MLRTCTSKERQTVLRFLKKKRRFQWFCYVADFRKIIRVWFYHNANVDIGEKLFFKKN